MSYRDSISFFVVPGRTEEFLDKMGSSPVHFDEASRQWKAYRDTLDFSQEGVRASLREFGPLSPGSREWRAAAGVKGVEGAAVAQAVAEDVRSVSPSVVVAKQEVSPPKIEPVSESDGRVGSDRDAYAALAVNAKQNGRDFEASFIRYGFQLAIEGTSRDSQMGKLSKASPLELIRVLDRNADAYSSLSDKEDRIRFDHMLKHDKDWVHGIDRRAEAVGRTQSLDEAFARFTTLGFDEKKRLGSLGLKSPVGLEVTEIGRMNALIRGSKEMRHQYHKITGVELGGSYMARAGAAVGSKSLGSSLGSQEAPSLVATQRKQVETPRKIGGMEQGW